MFAFVCELLVLTGIVKSKAIFSSVVIPLRPTNFRLKWNFAPNSLLEHQNMDIYGLE